MADVLRSGDELRLLVVTAMFPTERQEAFGIVVRREVEELRRLGLSVQVVDKTPGWRAYAAQLWRARRAVMSADVVHGHYGTSGFVAALIRRRRPLVITLHGSDIALGPRPRWDKYWVQYLLSVAAASQAQCVIVQDVSMLKRLPQSLRSRTVVLGQGVALPEPTGEPRSGVLFLSDRRRAVKRFQLAEASVRLVDGLELHSLDQYPVTDLPAAMQRHEVGLLTSEREGMPVAVKEALAAGMRVVSVDLPSLRSVASDLPGVVVLTQHDPASIAAGLRIALSEPLSAAETRTKTLAYLARRGWTEPERTRELAAIYARLANQSGFRATRATHDKQ